MAAGEPKLLPSVILPLSAGMQAAYSDMSFGSRSDYEANVYYYTGSKNAFNGHKIMSVLLNLL